MNKKEGVKNNLYSFDINFKVTDSQLTQSEFAQYLVELFQIGQQQIALKDRKIFFWDLWGKYNKNTDKRIEKNG